MADNLDGGRQGEGKPVVGSPRCEGLSIEKLRDDLWYATNDMDLRDEISDETLLHFSGTTKDAMNPEEPDEFSPPVWMPSSSNLSCWSWLKRQLGCLSPDRIDLHRCVLSSFSLTTFRRWSIQLSSRMFSFQRVKGVPSPY